MSSLVVVGSSVASAVSPIHSRVSAQVRADLAGSHQGADVDTILLPHRRAVNLTLADAAPDAEANAATDPVSDPAPDPLSHPAANQARLRRSGRRRR
mmetsp:Transcript_12305/g.40225  ORF Transcript_12305/g.40225 Transcript_12305/m.40225 type:complete len:97 (-) Transcript_12305:133-423(-)